METVNVVAMEPAGHSQEPVHPLRITVAVLRPTPLLHPEPHPDAAQVAHVTTVMRVHSVTYVVLKALAQEQPLAVELINCVTR